MRTGPAATYYSPRGGKIGPREGQAEMNLRPNSPGYYAPGEASVDRRGLVIDPRLAAHFYSGEHPSQFPVPGNREPAIVRDPLVTQSLATQSTSGAFRSRPADPVSDGVKFGTGPKQDVIQYPWVKKFIPPLALFNDACQWVNRLVFVRPMAFGGKDSSMPPLRSQYVTSPPIEVNNLAAGALNLQTQLGSLRIQSQRMVTAAQNYRGGPAS